MFEDVYYLLKYYYYFSYKTIFDIFNQETRDFFTNQCDCDDFFQEEFKLE